MAQLRLTSKGIVFLILVVSIIAFGIGFGVWQLSGPKTFDPTLSDAAGSGNPSGGCYGNGSPPPCDCALKCSEGGDQGVPVCNDSDGSVDGKCGGNTAPGTGKCTDYTLEHCPDGTWIKVGPGCKGKCAASPPKVNQCWCKSFDGCGEQCSFPPGTAGDVRDMAERSCGRFMAFCSIDAAGNTKVSIGEAGECWDERDVCKNPTAEKECTDVNVCDGGAVLTPTNSADYEVGDEVVLSGYAFDTDGIDKTAVVVKVDGVTVGNATVTDHPCTAASGNAGDKVCTAAGGKKAVKWTYTYTVTTSGAHTFNVTWKDTKGLGGSKCQGSRSITSNVQGNPDWDISKTGSAVCIDETAGSQMARVDYSIIIENVGDLTGQLTSLVDSLDSKVKNSYIQDSTISPDASVSGRVITWDLDGSAGQFDPNERKEFTYSIEVPQSAFGTYTNTATANPDSGETFQATEVTIASCNAPETGLFDSSISKVILGIILIGASGAYLYADGASVVSKKGGKKKREFEERVAGN